MKSGEGHQHHRHTPEGKPDTLPYRPLRSRRLVSDTGVQHHPRRTPELPMSQQQQDVLALLTAELQQATALARIVGRPSSGVTASLYALQARGLAERVSYKGWRLGDAKRTQA